MRVADIVIWASVAVGLLFGGSGLAQVRINELMHSPSNSEPEWKQGRQPQTPIATWKR